MLLLVGVLVAAAVAVIASERSSGPHIAAEEPISSYRIVYRLVFAGQAPETQERVVDRPYHGYDITRSTTGSGTDAIVTGLLQNDEGTFQYRAADSGGGGQGWLKLLDKRHLAPSDFRSLPGIGDQVRHGRARALGTRRVAGRLCTLVRIGGPLGTSDAFKRPTTAEHADECIDRTGIVLQEQWTLDGKRARTLDAITFEPRYRVPADAFTPVPRLPDPRPGALGQVDVDIDTATRASFQAQVRPFGGFHDDGGVLEVKLSALGGGSGGTAIVRLRRGLDVIEVQQHAGAPTAQPGDRTETVAPWGTVRFHPDTFASTYEVPLGDNVWLQLRTADLTALRGALTHLVRRARP